MIDLVPDPILPPLPDAEYEALRDSIEELGVQVPLLVTCEGRIIDGHERLRACLELGLHRYPMRIMGGMSEAERRERAIRLNAERRHLTRKQRRELLESLIRDNPARSTRDVADLLRVSKSTVSRTRQTILAGVPDGTPEFIEGRDGKVYPYRHPAVAVETRRQAQEACDLLNDLGDDSPEGSTTLRMLRTLVAQNRRQRDDDSPIPSLPAQIRIKHCSLAELKPRPGSISLILSDPPWGQNEATLALLDGLGAMAAKALRPGGLLLSYCGQAALPQWLEILRRHLTYRWQIVCVNASGHSIAPTRGSFSIMNGYRCMLMFSQGHFKPHRAIKDTLVTDGAEKGLHEWQQPLSEALYYIERLCPPGGLVCDPYLGSGTTALAVLRAGGGRRFLGCDISAQVVRVARRRIAEVAKAGRQAVPEAELATV